MKILAVFMLSLLAGVVLMAGRTPTSALSYAGGTSTAPYTMATSWAPTLAAASDEFTTDTSANWTLQAAGGTGTTVISPTSTPSVSLFNFSTFTPGWLAVQAESATGAAYASKALTLATNVAIYSRITPGKRGTSNDSGVTDNDGTIGVVFAATSASAVDTSNFVTCLMQLPGSGVRTYSVAKMQAGVFSNTNADRVTASAYGGYDTILLQKRTADYHCWVCRSMSGTCGWVGSVSWGGAATLDRVGLVAENAVTTAPGPLTQRLDYFRIVEADNVLP